NVGSSRAQDERAEHPGGPRRVHHLRRPHSPRARSETHLARGRVVVAHAGLATGAEGEGNVLSGLADGVRSLETPAAGGPASVHEVTVDRVEEPDAGDSLGIDRERAE